MKLDSTSIGQNVTSATEYNKLYYALNAQIVDIIDNKPVKRNSGGTTGFIPFNIEFTLDGISGIKIYNKLTIDTAFLPNGYPTTLDFIVTGINHTIKDGDWETNIKVTLIPKFDVVEVNDVSQPFTAAPEEKIKTAPTVTPSPGGGTVVIGNQKLSTVLQNAGYTPGTFIYEWALIQGTIEGYGVAGTIATRQNNPGNLRGGSYPDIDPGATKMGDFAKFSTPELGAKAMVEKFLKKWSNGNYSATVVNAKSSAVLSLKDQTSLGVKTAGEYRIKYKVPSSLEDIAGKSIKITPEQFYYIYAPPSDKNDTEKYINDVVKSLQKKFPGFNRNEKLIDWINR